MRYVQTKFYTAMYHAMLAPTTFSEAGDWYKGFDKNVHRYVLEAGVAPTGGNNKARCGAGGDVSWLFAKLTNF